MNLPNSLTLIRIILIPVFVLIYIFTDHSHWLAGVLFGIACVTDWLDGYFARRMNVSTSFGEFLDPVADKLIVVTALVVLIGAHGSLLLTLPGVVIIGREILISALREWMASMNNRGLVAVVWLSKIKTLVQMVAIAVLLCNPPQLNRPWVIVGLIMVYGATFMTLWSMLVHLRAAWSTLKDGFTGSTTPSSNSGRE